MKSDLTRTNQDAYAPVTASTPHRADVEPAEHPERAVPHIVARGIRKSFGGVAALTDVDLTILRGEVHALIGENGAGKSTIGKILAGVVRRDAGSLLVDGHPRDYRSPSEAIRDGIAMIDQELAILPMRSVLDNIFLGSEFASLGVLRSQQARSRFDDLIAASGFDLRPDALAGSLRLADQQKVEILRALARDARLIVMDEPSAALTPAETVQLHSIIRTLTSRGTTVILVSHFLEEVLKVSDRVTILRDGRLVRTTNASDESPQSLVSSMLGRDHSGLLDNPISSTLSPNAPVVLQVDELSRAGSLSGVSFTVRKGEIVGLSGLVGSGRTEVCRAIFGADRIDSGSISIDGSAVKLRSPHDAIAAGIAMLPESRKELGLLMDRSVRENISISHLREFADFGVLRSAREKRAVDEIGQKVGVKYRSAEDAVGTLSGGNQQKVLLGRWILKKPRILIVDEPTRGVDVGAKAAIYDLIRHLAASGVAVVVVSSEIEEILALTHRVIVMSRGRAVAEFETSGTTKDQLLQAAFETNPLAETSKVRT